MIKSVICTALSSALEKLKEIIVKNERDGKKTVVFCEDRLTLAAERTVCAAVGGTFSVSVYTFARFLSSRRGKRGDVLSSQGSAMAIRRIIEENKDKLKLFGKFSASAAAGAVYDTIALLYSSKISAEDVGKAAAQGLLESKLHDISVIYTEYENYLKASGKTDRNAYLGELPEVINSSADIAESEVIFLGFQSFTRSVLDCVRAVFYRARSVYGLFIGGKEDLYVNEGAAAFEGAAESFGGAVYEYAPSTLIPEAEKLRENLFNPECFYFGGTECANVGIYEAADEDEEMEFIAASIKKHVIDGGERYAKISVMLPDVAKAERRVARIFSQYRIPYYADRRHPLSEHPVCAFISDYLSCVVSGCSFKDTDGVISSPLFPASRADKDIYRNYALRLADFRGAVRREPKKEILAAVGFDYDAVMRVRETFLKGLGNLPARGTPSEVCEGIRNLLRDFKTQEKLNGLSERFSDLYPASAEFSSRVYEAVLTVLAEAEDIAGDAPVPLKEFIKILKSGFAALEISLIPPKADAVFVGDLAATANTGSNIVFAAGLTGEVPGSSSDTALLTDGEIAALEKINLDISPKIMQVNMRRRETTALNICAFRNRLYLTYPARSGGEESTASEIIAYASATFLKNGAPLGAVEVKKLSLTEGEVPYYCSERLPALKMLSADLRPEIIAAVYEVLKRRGLQRHADAAVRPAAEKKISEGRALFVSYGSSISPTALEAYFYCPYRNFMQQGLKLQERAEGSMRPLDTGNFIHAVLQKIAPELHTFADDAEVRARAEKIAEQLLNDPAYSSLTDTKSGEYTASELKKEAGTVSAGAYEQLVNSKFSVEQCETRCEIVLDRGIKVGGRIDRVDSCGDMVRIIDYKTGSVDGAATPYYMGLKLQLPLYLTAAAEGRRAVAAYYFPASVEYKSKADGVFRLQGFMDGSDEVVSVSDTTVEPKQKSAYFDAYLSGKKIDSAMPPEDFADFLKYSALVARKGTREMLDGNIAPSPAENACTYCKMGGSCGFTVGVDGSERTSRTVKCSDIARIVRKERGDE